MLRSMTKGQLRSMALTELRLRGCEMWIQNNLAVPGRKFIGKLGQSDLIGYNKKTGVMIAAEVKTKNDFLSDEQREFLSSLKRAGGIALLVKEENGQMVIENFPV